MLASLRRTTLGTRSKVAAGRNRPGQRPYGGRVTLVTAFLLLISATIAPAAAAQESCLKLVFGRYCLGGDVNVLLRQPPQPLVRQEDGERQALIYSEGRDDLYVLAFRNRIYKVLRRYGLASQLRYDDLYRLLRDKYGPGRDQSRFRAHADTPARRLAAIRRGEGRAVHFWSPAESWHIELNWTRELGLSLAYVDTARDNQQRAMMVQGY